MTGPAKTTGLRALAERATPGPWQLSDDGPPPDIIAGASVVACTLPSDRTRDEDTHNAAFIAAANPAAVLALLDERDRLRRGWLRVIQTENICPATGGGCLARRCGCVEEMKMLMQEAANA